VQLVLQQTPSTQLSPPSHWALVVQAPPAPAFGTQAPFVQLAPASHWALEVHAERQAGAVCSLEAPQKTLVK
jgi:hypothetical protein